MNLKKIIILFLIILPCLVTGQGISPSTQDDGQAPACGVDFMLKAARKNPVFRSREAEMNRQILLTPVTLSADFTLPVVFHIIADTPSLVTDAEILNALKDLNDAFAKTGNYSVSTGADTKIQFCMANTDPSGGITNGITRTSSFFGNDLNSSIEDARLKNLVYWDPLHYINIWYVKNIQNENFFMFSCGLTNGSQWKRIGTEGYAPLPAIPLDSADGIVVSKFGSILAHEMGHYLGLYHTFEGGCSNADCTVNGDKVCDTPPDNSYLPSSCTNPANTCNSDTLSNYSNGFFRQDVPDQVENFMDYGNWNCSNKFTNGQAQRMRATIVAFRKELLDSKCNPPCNENIVSSFTRNLPYPLPGQTVNFTNTSSGVSNFEWYVNDTLLSTTANYSYTFTDTGKYNIRLKAFNGNPSCFSTTSDYVIVTCGVTSRFFADKQQIASKIGFATDSILFKNTSENGTSFKWLVSNNTGMTESVLSTQKDFLYTFPGPGDYKIRLIASNGGCTDTTLAYEVPVADPTPDVRPVIYRADCYEQTKVRLVFSICNRGYTPIAPGAPISFYDSDPRLPGAKKIGNTFLLPDSLYGGGGGSCCSTQFTEILDAKREGLDQIYVSFNDKGTSVPVKYPAGNIIEKNYLNNVAAQKFFHYRVSVNPPSATVLPGDSIKLTASTLPAGSVSTFRWSPPTGLTCTNCADPILVADSTREYTVAVQSEYKCFDTTEVTVKVPPVYDYSISIESISCTSDKDSLLIDFTVYNSYRKPLLPKGLPV
jgi:PKD repeat protein